MADALLQSLALTPRQRDRLAGLLADLRGQRRWHGALPVALLNRCWLKLEIVAIENLARRLPPDASAEAPELVRYRQLVAAGVAPLQAQAFCWQDYGLQACHEAQARFWRQQDAGNHGWTLERYLALLQTYRSLHQDDGRPSLPLLILARPDSSEAHELRWLH